MEEPKKVTLLLNHPASATMVLKVGKEGSYYHSTWPIEEVVRKLGWEGKKDAVLCIHYCFVGDRKDPVAVVIELSPDQPKPPPPETKSPPPRGTNAEAVKSLKLCEACGQQNEQANLHCIHCGAPFPNPPLLTPVSTAPAA